MYAYAIYMSLHLVPVMQILDTCVECCEQLSFWLLYLCTVQADEMQSCALTADDFITEIQFLQSRATHYWRKAIDKLEKLERFCISLLCIAVVWAAGRASSL